MINPSPQSLVQALFELYGSTFSRKLGINLAGDLPDEYFKLLTFSLLFSVGNDGRAALSAAEALFKAGVGTPERMASASADRRLGLLAAGGYRYDREKAAAMLADMGHIVAERYDADPRKIRERAGRDPAKERRLIEEFAGIGEVGCDIFFQEAQSAWDELYPCAGGIALRGARKIGFAPDAARLAPVVPAKDYPRFIASLTQMEQADESHKLVEEARKLEAFMELQHSGRGGHV